MDQVDTLKPMMLPLEIIVKICSYVSVHELRNRVSQVSSLWNNARNYVTKLRTAMVDRLSEEERRELVIQFPSNWIPNRLDLIRKYESKHIVGKLRVKKLKINRPVLMRLLGGHLDSTHGNELLTLNELYKLIPAYKLVCIQGENGGMRFLHHNQLFLQTIERDITELNNLPTTSPSLTVDDLESSQVQDVCYTPVGVIPFSPHFRKCSCEIAMIQVMDIYHNKVLLKNNGMCHRFPVLYEISEVSHLTRTIKFEVIKEIYFPFPTIATRIYGNNRLVTVFANGYVGLWRGSNDGYAEHFISKRRLTGRVSADTKIFRIGSVVIIQSEREKFDIVDPMSEEEDIDMSEVPFLNILGVLLPIHGNIYTKVLDIQLTGNILLVKSEVIDKKKKLHQILCALKLRRHPTVDDFLAADKLQDLVNLDDSTIRAVAGNSILLVPSSIVPGRFDDPLYGYIKATFITIPNFDATNLNHRIAKVKVFDIVESLSKLSQEVYG